MFRFKGFQHFTLIWGNASVGYLFYQLELLVIITTFNNVSVISWMSVLLVEDLCISSKKHQSERSLWQMLTIKFFLVHFATGWNLTRNLSGDRQKLWMMYIFIRCYVINCVYLRILNRTNMTRSQNMFPFSVPSSFLIHE